MVKGLGQPLLSSTTTPSMETTPGEKDSEEGKSTTSLNQEAEEKNEDQIKARTGPVTPLKRPEYGPSLSQLKIGKTQ